MTRAFLVSTAPPRDLGRLLEHAYYGTPYYRRRLAAEAARLGDLGPEDLWRLPVTPREDLRADWRAFRAEGAQAVWVSWSGGTMGKPKVIFHTREDVEWAHQRNTAGLRMMGVSPKDLVATALPFGMWFVGWDHTICAARLGATVAPVGLGFGPQATLETMAELGATVLISTPGAVRDMADYVTSNPKTHQPSLRMVIVLGEAIGPAFRTTVRERLGGEVFSILGAAEFDGMAVECQYHDGFHVLPDTFWFEIRPLSRPREDAAGPEDGGTDGGLGDALGGGDPTGLGPVGELIVTPRMKLGTPLVRYVIGDIARASPPCPCGWPGSKFVLVGRSDDAVALGDGTKVYLYQVEAALGPLGADIAFFRLILDREGGVDQLTLEVETPRAGDPAFSAELAERLAHLSVDFEDSLRLGAVAQPRVRAAGHLEEERTSRGKARRIVDLRRR